MSVSFKPLGDRVVVEAIKREEKTAGGIYLPDSAKEKPIEGTVISVGKGTRDAQGNLIPMELKAGDKIIFGKWAGTEVKVGGTELLIMKESDVMGVL
jgi:chaperonin GroES